MQSPDHYGDTRLMDLLVDKNVGFAEGNVMKYVYRWKDKDGLKDLYKARVYLDAIITHAELKSTASQILAVQPSIFATQKQTTQE